MSENHGGEGPEFSPGQNTSDTSREETFLPGGFAIVGVGASAGGVEAFSELLRSLPADTGMAFVLVQHLDPRHESILAELLAARTSMPVTQIHDSTEVEPNHVYVIPPNTTMTVVRRTLQLAPRSPAEFHKPIDASLISLAKD